MSMTVEEARRNMIEATLNAGYMVCVDVDAVVEMLRAEEELQQYRAIGTVSEFRENKNFLEFLHNTIQPNEMEQYLAMYNASEEKGE